MPAKLSSNISKLYVIKLSKWLMLTVPIVFLFYKENGLATRDLFLLKAAYSFAIVVLEIPSGYFGDVWGRKASLILGSFLGFLGFSLYTISNGFWSFLLCELILGMGQSFISGSDSALLYDTLQESGRPEAYLKQEGRLISLGNFAEAIAAPIGVALAAISLRTPYFFQALIAFSAIPASLLLVEPPRHRIDPKKSGDQLKKIITYALTTNKRLRWSILFSSAMGTATLTMAWMIQPFFHHLAVPLALYGLFIPGLNLTTGAVSMHAWRVEKTLGDRATVFFIAGSIGLLYFALSLGETLWAVGLLYLFYMARGVATPTLRNHINTATPSEIRATVLSIRSLIIRLCFVALGPFLGWFADSAGIPSTFGAGGLLFTLCGLVAALKFTIEARRPQPAWKN